MNDANRNDETFEDIDALLEGHFYKLVDKEPVPCTFAEYASGMKSSDNRIIEQTRVGELTVSTVLPASTMLSARVKSNSSKPAFLDCRTTFIPNGDLPAGLTPSTSIFNWFSCSNTTDPIHCWKKSGKNRPVE